MGTGYGKNRWCADELSCYRYSTGLDNLALALYRRLKTPMGTLAGDARASDYGRDLGAYIGAFEARETVYAIPAIGEAELRKDDRVLSVSGTGRLVAGDDGLVTVLVTFAIVARDSGESFQFTMSVAEAETAYLGTS